MATMLPGENTLPLLSTCTTGVVASAKGADDCASVTAGGVRNVICLCVSWTDGAKAFAVWKLRIMLVRDSANDKSFLAMVSERDDRLRVAI